MRQCFQTGLQVQRHGVHLLRLLRNPAAAQFPEPWHQGVLIQCVRPSLMYHCQQHMCSMSLSSGHILATNQSRRLHVSAHCFKKRIPAEPEPRELDLLRYDMKAIKNSPKPAIYLGLAGLIPFVSVPLIMGVTEVYYPELAFAQVAYGASILSFLGGARWGFAIPEGSPAKPDWMNLGNSVVSPLLAWGALLFHDNLTEATLLVIMGFGIALHYDLGLLPTYPAWFKALRTILTVVAVFSLVGTLVASATYPEKSLQST
ncbi:hypothetical protein NDU88_001198 [Pleurodeles waltl]|uniref:Transmembrane protein 69 n=2 Tax=Pleurodeles waltl TaxID=8319 RepID=A0AAV7SZB8_PLEWA|nr:hypothetical protein NDU88_001198 [Pleurodeles waltl]